MDNKIIIIIFKLISSLERIDRIAREKINSPRNTFEQVQTYIIIITVDCIAIYEWTWKIHIPMCVFPH